MTDQRVSAKRSPALVVLAWAVVGLPWLWGIIHTWQNAEKLFR